MLLGCPRSEGEWVQGAGFRGLGECVKSLELTFGSRVEWFLQFPKFTLSSLDVALSPELLLPLPALGDCCPVVAKEVSSVGSGDGSHDVSSPPPLTTCNNTREQAEPVNNLRKQSMHTSILSLKKITRVVEYCTSITPLLVTHMQDLQFQVVAVNGFMQKLVRCRH